MDPFDDLYARVIVEHALAVRAGQTVLVEGGEAAEPLARAVHRRVLEAGGHPTVQMLPGRLDRDQGRERERRGAGRGRSAQAHLVPRRSTAA